MKHFNRISMAMAALLAIGCSWGNAEKDAKRSDSELVAEAPLFDLSLELTDQHGHERSLETFRGHPTLVSMFYADCPYACPTLISDIRRLEAKLDEDTLGEVRVLLVSFDPKRDTPERLRTLAVERKLDQARWTLANASDDGVRELAAALGFKYRRLEDGNYNHTSAIVLLRSNGAVATRVEGLNQDLDGLAAAVTTAAEND